jgi:putative ABC transport system permease protein
MAPGRRALDDEIRGHIAISIQERIERGEDPEAARLAAMKEFGNLLLTRESIESVWRPRWVETLFDFASDIRVAMRSLQHARGLAATVALMLALGIGANAAVFSVVRQVLFRPLVNRDAERLVYVRQKAPGLGSNNITFSMAEIRDLRAASTKLASFGDFSTLDFTLVGFGDPRVVKAGVVSGSYFEVMGLRPVLGRLIDANDDGAKAEPVAVLTHRFWTTALKRDASVVGRKIRLGSRIATVIGVLEPSLPWPADTELIANVVASPHHLGATMVMQRTHRMTELFGRLAPGATVAEARAELEAAHAVMMAQHPESYPASARTSLVVRPFRDQLTAPARNVLLMLLGAAGVVFAIACSNVANLILARTVRRESELAVRAALGAGRGALRRMLLAESLVLCGTGAVLGVLLAQPLVGVVSRFAARFSVRALDVTVDPSLLWVGTGLALVAAVALAYVPRLPSTLGPAGCGKASRGLRLTPGTDRRLRAFAVTQVALSFVLLAGAGLIVSALLALQSAPTGFEMRRVLALDVPVPLEAGASAVSFFREATRRIALLPGVERVAAGNFVPWRDASGDLLPRLPFGVEGHTPAPGEAEPHARLRIVTPGFFMALGIPLLSGRDFDDGDAGSGEPVVIVSQSVAQRLFRDGDALGKRLWWRSPVLGNPQPRRIVGISADADDENVVPGPSLTVYHPLSQIPYASRIFVQASGDPYALVAPLRRTIRDISPLQPVERAATLADVRSEVLAPERRRAFVMSGIAGVALLIAVVGVAGVLAFTVSARTREFGVRLALGASRRQLLGRVLGEGALIASVGIAAGAAGGYALGRLATSWLESARLPGGLALLGAAAVLLAAAVVASLMPAARASRVDVTQALRSE